VPLAFHQVFCLQAFANLNFSSPALVLPKNSMAGSNNRRQASDEAEGSRAGARWRR
jgi:hypothetical protein